VFDNIKKLCRDMCFDKKIFLIDKDSLEINKFKQKSDLSNHDSRSKCFNKLLKCCEGDCILLSHDDFFIKDEKIIDNWFEKIETNTFDFSYFTGVSNNEYGKLICDRYGKNIVKENSPSWIKDDDEYFPWGVNSYGFCSNLQTILNTDGIFDCKSYKKGEVFESLKYTIKNDISFEYFIFFNIKLYELGYKKSILYGDGVYTGEKKLNYSYINVEEFIHDNILEYVHACLGSSFFVNIIDDDYGNLIKSLTNTYSSNRSSTELLERFIYFNIWSEMGRCNDCIETACYLWSN